MVGDDHHASERTRPVCAGHLAGATDAGIEGGQPAFGAHTGNGTEDCHHDQRDQRGPIQLKAVGALHRSNKLPKPRAFLNYFSRLHGENPELFGRLQNLYGRTSSARTDQRFRIVVSFFSRSSNDIEPLSFSPLMKKVGVASTFNWSKANC